MPRSPLRLGVLATFVTLGFAGVVGLIAVFDADSVSSGFGRGFGIAVLVFLTGATIAVALACLSRERARLASLGSIAAAGVALDLLVLAVCFEIKDVTYTKTTGVVFVWGFFALLALALTLAVRPVAQLARILYGGAVGATVLSAAIATWLIATAGHTEIGFSPYPAETSNDDLLRVLGATLVVLAALWFSALAASRLERASLEPS
jgi:hypothetical protein